MIQVIKRAAGILEIIARAPDQPRALSEIVAETGLNAATCARILKTLVNIGYVEQVAPKKGYVLGIMAYALAARGQYGRDLAERAKPVMLELVKDIHQPVLIAALRNYSRIIISQFNPSETGNVDMTHSVSNPYQTATGRLLIANLDERELKNFMQTLPLPGNDWPEADTRQKLQTTLQRIRETGWTACHTGEVTGIAFPVVQNNKTIAALGTFFPATSFTGKKRERLLRKVKTAAQKISEKI